ncbi:MAG: SDR family NAD(P)-dependent oxidoreductase [Candidatus Gastranaerophilales bacterium]|nr:SDR family NAD(P)-dependent oxidoreductase [Candidatus Gastranaerophilales bacterium]
MKTYIITGATSGIGKALTEYFSKDNIVFAGYRNESKKADLEKLSSNIIPFYVDYAKPETISSAVDFIKSKAKNIDTLINVAGCVVAGAIDTIPVSELRRQFDTNVFGHIELTQGLLSILDDGKIINISSMASYGIFPFISPYCSSKRALDILFNCLSLETKQNIKVVSVKPGAIATPLWSKSIEENTETIENCTNYDKETAYLKKNALKNELHGLSVSKVVEKIVKIDKMDNPKPSYCVGNDAVFTSIISKLPQCLLNKLIKLKLKRLTK